MKFDAAESEKNDALAGVAREQEALAAAEVRTTANPTQTLAGPVWR